MPLKVLSGIVLAGPRVFIAKHVIAVIVGVIAGGWVWYGNGVALGFLTCLSVAGLLILGIWIHMISVARREAREVRENIGRGLRATADIGRRGYDLAGDAVTTGRNAVVTGASSARRTIGETADAAGKQLSSARTAVAELAGDGIDVASRGVAGVASASRRGLTTVTNLPSRFSRKKNSEDEKMDGLTESAKRRAEDIFFEEEILTDEFRRELRRHLAAADKGAPVESIGMSLPSATEDEPKKKRAFRTGLGSRFRPMWMQKKGSDFDLGSIRKRREEKAHGEDS